MAYLTKYGSVWGMIPNTAGRVFWVAPSASYTVDGRSYSASDANDGLSPERALLTLDRAFDSGMASANVGDVIVLLPGAHSWSASVAVDVAGITITGLPSGAGNPWRHKTSITTSAADEIMNITAADIEIAYLHVIPVTTKAAIDFTGAADRLYVHDCSFDMYSAAANTGTKGLAVTAVSISADDVVIARCRFLCNKAQGNAIEMGDSFRYEIEDCEFKLYDAATWASAVSLEGVTSNTGIVRNCRFYGAWGSTYTVGITGASIASTMAVAITDCRFLGNSAAGDKWIDTFGSSDAIIAENYDGSVGGGSGGALHTIIT